jgi:hypothetical protein
MPCIDTRANGIYWTYLNPPKESNLSSCYLKISEKKNPNAAACQQQRGFQ